MCNWLPTTYRTVVTMNFATLLFQTRIKSKFNIGKLVFEHILGHAENATYRKAIGYPSLKFGIFTAQKHGIVTPTDILESSATEMRINHKLFEGHLRDVPSGKKAGKMPRRIPETILEHKPEPHQLASPHLRC